MKQTKTFGLIFVLVALLCSVQSWAGSSYYKNLSITTVPLKWTNRSLN